MRILPAILLALAAPVVAAQDYAWDQADVDQRRSAFIERMLAEHDFDRATPPSSQS